MNSFTVTATELKNNTSEILDKVVYSNKKALITKHGNIIAEITPKTGETLSIKNLIGLFPNLPDVKKNRTKNKNRFKMFL